MFPREAPNHASPSKSILALRDTLTCRSVFAKHNDRWRKVELVMLGQSARITTSNAVAPTTSDSMWRSVTVDLDKSIEIRRSDMNIDSERSLSCTVGAKSSVSNAQHVQATGNELPKTCAPWTAGCSREERWTWFPGTWWR